MAVRQASNLWVKVTPEQRARIDAKAREYGITASELARRSIDAYVRVADAKATTDLVAVNYGVWTFVASAVVRLEGLIGKTDRDVRSLKTFAGRLLVAGPSQVRELGQRIRSCCEDLGRGIADARSSLEGIRKTLLAIEDRQHLADLLPAPLSNLPLPSMGS